MTYRSIEDDLMRAYRASMHLAETAQDIPTIAFYHRLSRRILLVIRDMRKRGAGIVSQKPD